ncbi:MAG: hypothetical protein KTR25_05360 [Myxococcales bacterium]|nr:hypothetical protein [Myxococcales bacterium]
MATEKKHAKPKTARAVTVTLEPTLSALEERVLRAKHGSCVPAHFPLAQKDEGADPAVKAKVRAIEQLALARSGRLAEMRAELEAEERELASQETTKSKIVSALRVSPPKEP